MHTIILMVQKRLPLKVYGAYNDYLKLKNKPDGKVIQQSKSLLRML